jgi:galactose mutarotase-like enzyme
VPNGDRRRRRVTLPSLELRGGTARVTIIPALGGKIGSLVLAGREWLWTSDVIPHRAPDARSARDETSYVETADTGGYDECFPTVGACDVPAGVERYAGLRLPDHGELWSQAAEVEGGRDADAEWAVARWRGRRMPYRFARTVRVGGDGVVTMRYAATNDGDRPLPFLWSSHPLLPLTPSTRVVLPDGARVRVYAQHGIDVGGAGAEHRWPLLAVAGELVDFSRPDRVGAGYACKLFVDMPVGRAAVEENGARLEVAFDVREVPNLGLWINRRGWTPFAGGTPYLNLAFEPCIGAPDTLSDALGDWHGAHWLRAGETREWELRWRGETGLEG